MGEDSKDIFWAKTFSYGCSFWSLLNLCHRHSGGKKQDSKKDDNSEHSPLDKRPVDFENLNKISKISNESASHESIPFNVQTMQPKSTIKNLGCSYDVDSIVLTNSCGNNIHIPQVPSFKCKLKTSPELTELSTSSIGISANEKSYEIKDGRYFMLLLNSQQLDLEKRSISVKLYLDEITTEECHEEVEGLMRSAVGKANLLIHKRFNQFRKLCESNMDPNLASQSVTNEDLMGYWDIVRIQVEEIKKMFDQIEQAKSNNWQCSKDNQGSIHMVRTAIKGHGLLHTKGVRVHSRSINETRKKLLEIKEEGRQKKKKSESDDIIIFCSHKTGA